MMKWIWPLMLALGILYGMAAGRADAVAAAFTASAGEAVTLSISLAGAYMFWMGIMRVAGEAGLVKKLSRFMTPVLRPLFPGAPDALAPITLNLAANFFGLGSAATPFGLEAMRELKKASPSSTASDEMVMFLALNSSAIELLPSGVLALRAACGSADVYCVVVPTFLASIVVCLSAIAACRLFCRLRPADRE